MTDDDPRWHLRARSIAEELYRVLCNEPPMRSSGALEPVLVPFVGLPDALRFLRTVPTGASRVELERLAAAYCVAHPVPLPDE
jgi:hypothetical protein